jgi:hypothetical protein
MTMPVLPNFTLPVAAAAAIVLAVTGCQASGSAGSSQPPAPAASAPSSQGTAAAGSPTTPAASGGNDHPCLVVTEQEATTALGADPGPGQETPPGAGGLGTCVYGAGSSVVRLSVDTSGVGKAIYDSDRSSYPSASTTDVPGVGDGAFEIATIGSQVTVYFYKGGTFVSITLGTAATTGPPKDQVIALATAAAGRV